jgi:hypothetical protein
MNKKLFRKLVESVQEMTAIDRGERQPSRRFVVKPISARCTPARKRARV